MPLRPVALWLVVASALLATACTNQGLPALLGPSACSAGGDRCAGLSCPPGTHCSLTSSCAAFCEQEQLTSH